MLKNLRIVWEKAEGMILHKILFEGKWKIGESCV